MSQYQSRVPKIKAAVQVAVDWSYGKRAAKEALRALDTACTQSELSDIAPCASAIRLCIFYADMIPREFDLEATTRRVNDLQAAVKALAIIILGRVRPTSEKEALENAVDDYLNSQEAVDFKKRAAGDFDAD